MCTANVANVLTNTDSQTEDQFICASTKRAPIKPTKVPKIPHLHFCLIDVVACKLIEQVCQVFQVSNQRLSFHYLLITYNKGIEDCGIGSSK